MGRASRSLRVAAPTLSRAPRTWNPIGRRTRWQPGAGEREPAFPIRRGYGGSHPDDPGECQIEYRGSDQSHRGEEHREGLEKEGDLLIMGSSIDRLLSQTVFGGLPMEVARARTGATLVVKRAEAAMHFWKRRTWELLDPVSCRPLRSASDPRTCRWPTMPGPMWISTP